MAPPRSGKYTPWTTLERELVRADLRISELAVAVGFSQSHLYEVLGGRASPSQKLTYRLATHLGVADPFELWASRPSVPPRNSIPREARPATSVA